MNKLFYSHSTCSTASHIILEESGLPYEGIEVSWKKKLNVSELDQLNTLGAVPVFVTAQGQVITQNTAILEFIADQVPEKNLLSKAGTVERAQTMSWVSFVAADLQKAFVNHFRSDVLTTIIEAQKELENHATRSVKDLLAHIESSIGDRTYITGDHFTIADAYLFVISGWAEWIEIDLSEYKKLSHYRARIAERPSVKKILDLDQE